MKIFYTSNQDLMSFVLSENKEKNINAIDANDKKAEQMIFLLNQTSLFNEEPNNMYVNCNFFRKIKENDFAKILEISNGAVFFYLTKEKEKIPDFMAKHVSEIPKLTKLHLKKIITKHLHNKIIDDKLSEMLIALSSANPLLLNNNLSKINSYCMDKDVIVEEDIKNLLFDTNEPNIFMLLNNILLSKISEALKLMDRLIMDKFSILDIINIISTQLFWLKIIKVSLLEGKNNFLIQKETGFTIGQIFSYSNIIKNVTLEKMNDLMNFLFNLDYNIKKNIVEPYTSFKILIVKHAKQ